MNFIEIKNKEENPSINYKIIVIGDSGVGKSNFIRRFIGDEFKSDSISTIGVDLYSKEFEVSYYHNKNQKQDKIKVNIWDTAGQERYKSVTSSYYKGSNGVFVVYDTTKEESFKNVDNWLNDVYSYCVNLPSIIIVGTKSDLFNLKVIEERQLELKAEQYSVMSIETSAKNNEYVQEAFHKMMEDIHYKHISLVNSGKLDSNNISQKLIGAKNDNKKFVNCC